MSVKKLFEIKRFGDEQVCAFCGNQVSEKALTVRQQLLAKFPYIGVLFYEIKRNRGSDVFCDDHLLVLIEQCFVIKRRGNRSYLVLRKNAVKRLANRLYYQRISTLVQRDAVDRLYERNQPEKEPAPKQITLEEFAMLFQQAARAVSPTFPDVTLDDVVRMIQTRPRRRQPCWMNPPRGECVYKNSCSKADICGGSSFEAFLPGEVKRPKMPQLTHEFYWDYEPCEQNCPDCSPDCPYVKRLELKVRKVEAKPKRWRRKQRKWPNRSWSFLGREGRAYTSHWLIGDDYITYETDAGGAPLE